MPNKKKQQTHKEAEAVVVELGTMATKGARKGADSTANYPYGVRQARRKLRAKDDYKQPIDSSKEIWKEQGETANPTEDGIRGKLDELQGRLKAVLAEAAELPFPNRRVLVDKFFSEFQKLGSAAPALPAPDLSGRTYPLFVKRTDPVAHLERVWGIWLKKYNPYLERDVLDQKSLTALDPSLYHALRYRIRNRPAEKLADFVSAYTPYK